MSCQKNHYPDYIVCISLSLFPSKWVNRVLILIQIELSLAAFQIRVDIPTLCEIVVLFFPGRAGRLDSFQTQSLEFFHSNLKCPISQATKYFSYSLNILLNLQKILVYENFLLFF